MISKTEAIQLFNAFNNTFSARVEAQIRSAASSGLTSVTISYGTVPNAIAAATGAELTAAGWTVAVDTTAKTVTIS